MELSIILVTWNSWDYLRECIQSIRRETTRTEIELIVVDNASTIDDMPVFRNEFPEAIFVRNETNLGFAGANNLGFRVSRGEYVLFLNPDTVITDHAIDRLMRRIKTLPDAGVVGCKLLNSDLTVQTSSYQKFPTILNQLFDIEYLHLRWPAFPLWEISALLSPGDVTATVEAVSGACALLRRSVFEHVGLFTEDYFMYAEDIDLSYKTRRVGFTNYYIGEAVIVHHGGRSSSQVRVNQWSVMMKFRAMTRFLDKTRGRAYGLAFQFAMIFAALLRLAIIAVAVPSRSRLIVHQSAWSKWRAVLHWALRPSAGYSGIDAFLVHSFNFICVESAA